MVFSSVVFLFVFFPITILVYYLLKNNYRNYWLLFASLFFFGWSQYNYLWIIIVNILINYICAIGVDKIKKFRKIILVFSIFANLFILFYFKYFDFAIESVNNIFKCNFDLKNIILPIGISFFTFQGMSYVIDVYRKDVPSQYNVFKVALYIVLFPQLIAGPIVRYKEIEKEINQRSIDIEVFTSGIERFIIGLGKKTIIANTMAVLADSVWNNGASYNTWLLAWVGGIAYMLQIFFDFSGYSDMAIGLGRMFGFHFNENFKLPYTAKTISDFWRKWHISLSSWFRDYVYIPLGGNKKHVYLNLAIVFLLTGIWHGASWNFILWGIWNGVFILFERFIKNHTKGKSNKNIFINILLHFYTLLVVFFGWILFRAPNLDEAIVYFKTMFGLIVPDKIGFSPFWYIDNWTMTIMIVGIFFSTSIPQIIKNIYKKICPIIIYNICKYIFLIGLLYLSMIRIVSGTYNPFIYFQF